jgi:uncharacterized protein (TIGR02246 family)
MNPSEVQRWLGAYGRAWETKDPEAAVRLFTEDATYQETPFDEPMRGREAIRTYWSQVEPSQDDISFGSEVLHVGSDRALVHWWASYTNVKTGEPTKLNGIFLLEFDDSGLCRSLREWWHADPRPAF